MSPVGCRPWPARSTSDWGSVVVAMEVPSSYREQLPATAADQPRAPNRRDRLAGVKIEPPDPSLQDGVVLLRPWTDRDVPAIAACNEEEMAQWLDQIPHPYTEKDAREYVAATRGGWREGTASSFAIVDVVSIVALPLYAATVAVRRRPLTIHFMIPIFMISVGSLVATSCFIWPHGIKTANGLCSI